ncbi:MAG: hypothetical protein VX034_15075, partial [Planctomycetota bacterium]|nr:hypothetical protein [Planctomycetota bacterium]
MRKSPSLDEGSGQEGAAAADAAAEAAPAVKAEVKAEAEGEAAEGGDEEWLTSGHEWIGRRLRRFYQGEMSDGVIKSWQPPGAADDE